MVVSVDHMVSAREGTDALDRAIESIVSTIGRFGGNNVTSYLDTYQVNMIIRDMSRTDNCTRSLMWFRRTSMQR